MLHGILALIPVDHLRLQLETLLDLRRKRFLLLVGVQVLQLNVSAILEMRL